MTRKKGPVQHSSLVRYFPVVLFRRLWLKTSRMRHSLDIAFATSRRKLESIFWRLQQMQAGEQRLAMGM